jgi:porphobilinogen deaminase
MERLREWLPGIRFEVHVFSSPGDRDRETDLRISPDDFFTRDLDQAVLSTQIDLAVHTNAVSSDLQGDRTHGWPFIVFASRV